MQGDPKIVQLRFSGALSIEDASQVLGLSPATVKREGAIACLWLKRELRRGEAYDS
jgi:DNA-directed RNA polymerase specialized sigma24 family protein